MYVDVVQCFLDFTVLSIGSFIRESKSYNSLSRTYTLNTRIYRCTDTQQYRWFILFSILIANKNTEGG